MSSSSASESKRTLPKRAFSAAEPKSPCRGQRAGLSSLSSLMSEHVQPSMQPQKTLVYPVTEDSGRPYEEHVLNSCIAKNTLVCLPIGSSRAFIARALMLNMHRWFPERLVVLCASSRLLASQQLVVFNRLCSDLRIKAVEVLATMSPEKRFQAWNDSPIVFTTPQVLENDLQRKLFESQRVVCVVFDEAHWGIGSTACSEIVRHLGERCSTYRLCALTANPGPSVAAVQSVVDSLGIEHIVYLDEDSQELQICLNDRVQRHILVRLDSQILSTRALLDELIRLKYLMNLQQLGFPVASSIDGISVASLIHGPKKRSKVVNGYVSGLQMLVHIRDLLSFYGTTSMHSYVSFLFIGKASLVKMRIMKELDDFEPLKRTLDALRSERERPGHPKLCHVRDLLLEHFDSGKRDTRAAVFSQCSDSACEISSFLKQHEPVLRPALLDGQDSYYSRHSPRTARDLKLKTIEEFRKGTCNVIVATSIGEEGLDLDHVDLIIFYDVQSPPARSVKKPGRTEPQRQGSIVYLLSEGREEASFRQMQSNAQILKQALSRASQQFTHKPNSHSISINGPWNVVKVRTMPPKAPSKRVKPGPSLCASEYRPVPALSVSKSDCWELTKTRGVAHSARTLSLSSLFQLSSDSELIQSCRAVWKSAIASNPVFQPFDYQPNSIQDYRAFFETFLKSRVILPPSSEEDLDLPEEFFSIDELGVNEEHQSALEQYDWSDPEFS